MHIIRYVILREGENCSFQVLNTKGESTESGHTIQQCGYVDYQAMDREVGLPERFEHIQTQDPSESCMFLSLLSGDINFGIRFVMCKSFSVPGRSTFYVLRSTFYVLR